MKKAPLYALLTANTISMVGNVLTMLAVPWFVLETTGSAVQTGITGFFAVLPAVIALFFGGTIVDRLGFKRTSIIADLASGVTVAFIPLLYNTVGLEFWQLLVLVFFGALLDAPGTTARQSLVPDVAKLAGMRLERVNGIYQSIQRLSMLLGPPLAGVLIVMLGAGNVLWIDAATFAISALLIAITVPAGRPAPQRQAPYLEQLREGLAFIRRDRLIRSVVVTFAVTNFLDSPIFSVILPVYAKRNFGSATDLGMMLAGFGAGSTVGALVYSAIGHRLPRRATFLSTFFLAGLSFWLLATMPSFAVTVATMFFTGLAAGPINPLMMTVSQERIPAELRGRVFGMTGAVAYVAMPLGILISGYAVEALGVGLTVAAIALGYLAVTTGQFFNSALHEMEERQEAKTGEASQRQSGAAEAAGTRPAA